MEVAVSDSLKLQSPIRVVYKIPVVFHVLHNGGPENISRDQIEDAVAILNRDYRLQNCESAWNIISREKALWGPQPLRSCFYSTKLVWMVIHMGQMDRNMFC